MKRLLVLLLFATMPLAAIATDAVPLPPGATFNVPTTLGTATALVLPSSDGRAYLVLTIGGPSGQTIIPLVVMPYGTAPTPGPSPGPTPNPVAGKLFVLIVTETKDQTPEQAAVINSQAARDLMAAKGWQWRVVDQDVVDENGRPPPDLAKWISQAKAWAAAGNKLPCLLVLDEQGAVLSQGALPAIEAAYLDLLKKWGGP